MVVTGHVTGVLRAGGPIEASSSRAACEANFAFRQPAARRNARRVAMKDRELLGFLGVVRVLPRPFTPFLRPITRSTGLFFVPIGVGKGVLYGRP